MQLRAIVLDALVIGGLVFTTGFVIGALTANGVRVDALFFSVGTLVVGFTASVALAWVRREHGLAYLLYVGLVISALGLLDFVAPDMTFRQWFATAVLAQIFMVLAWVIVLVFRKTIGRKLLGRRPNSALERTE